MPLYSQALATTSAATDKFFFNSYKDKFKKF